MKSTLLSLSRVVLLWLVIVAAVYPFGRYHSNEYDRLPHARQSWDPDWLDQDWYLNRPGNPYQIFEAFLGPLVGVLGFNKGALVGRLVVYATVALALNVFFGTLRLAYAWGLLVAFVFFRHQSLVAGEWIAGAVEAKTVAYALALLGAAYLIQRRHARGWLCTGAAMSLHMLVGGYAGFCALGTQVLMNRREQRPWWSDLQYSAWLLLSGGFGLLHIVQRLAVGPSANSQRAGLIYVICRNPHHLLPLAWQKWLWILVLILATVLFVRTLRHSKVRAQGWMAAYALASVLLFVFGLLLFALRLIPLLKYYWFRFGDVMVPLIGLCLVALWMQRGLHRWLYRSDTGKDARHLRIRASLAFGAVAIITVSLYQIQVPRPNNPVPLSDLNAGIDPMLTWICNHTEPDAVVLADPLLWDFYLKAQRAMFVSLKHVPNLDEDILAWFERLKLCNSGRVPDKPSQQALVDLHHNFYRLTDEEIRSLAREFGLDYYLGAIRNDSDLQIIHCEGDYVLYRLAR